MRATTNGETTAGTSPSFTSLSAKLASRARRRRRRSRQAGRRHRRWRGPARRRRRAPGSRRPPRAARAAARVRDAPLGSRSIEARIQSRSAPAQNDGPAPRSTTTCVSPTSANAAVSASISAGSSALCRSWRASVSRRTGPSRSTSAEAHPTRAHSLQLDEQRAVGDRVALGHVDGLDGAAHAERGAASPSSSPRSRPAARAPRPRRPRHVHAEHGARHRCRDRRRARRPGVAVRRVVDVRRRPARGPAGSGGSRPPRRRRGSAGGGAKAAGSR